MKTLRPCRLTTQISRNREWIPESTDALLAEIEALKLRAENEQHLLLFRGHRCCEWRLDSTFVRTVKSLVFGMEMHHGFSAPLKESYELNAALTSLLLFKFGSLLKPSDELSALELVSGIDPWFELMKRYQQYHEEDTLNLRGTNFLDWSQSSDVALYFGNEGRNGEGALFVCDSTATGKTLQVLLVSEILERVREQFKNGMANGNPLLFSPPKQIAYQRAKNQQAVYFAQMEMRLDLLESWRLQEELNLNDETIILKIVVPRGSEDGLRKYLDGKNINEKFIYPDKGT